MVFEWSWLGLAQLRCPKKDRRRLQTVSDKNVCSVRDRTSSFETKSFQWIRRIRLRHQLSSASIFFDSKQVTDHTSYPYMNIGTDSEYWTTGSEWLEIEKLLINDWTEPADPVQRKHAAQCLGRQSDWQDPRQWWITLVGFSRDTCKPCETKPRQFTWQSVRGHP